MISGSDKHKFVFSARDNFIRDVDDPYDRWLYNPEWDILPRIAILPDGKGAKVLMCNDHNNGFKNS